MCRAKSYTNYQNRDGGVYNGGSGNCEYDIEKSNRGPLLYEWCFGLLMFLKFVPYIFLH